VITVVARSIPVAARVSSKGANMGISLVFAPTSTWPRTRDCSWVAAASRWTWLPSASVAPRTVLPSTAIATSADELAAGSGAAGSGAAGSAGSGSGSMRFDEFGE